ncbi:hypothetical protein CIL03_04000 [Virgibacillus indicus]|uniref:Flagellar hook-length control protein-like C-terminal domain-containing protein n=1 Tax=Virgibacillus indicus TaxID=2024554 RepID=A0A265NES1_9BACI|nr:flagellar hook-length control protein FliK [Virgibacillus indicus]OZU90317.1 hypothetical protein CIL03_04000 [Virgibacillus indicus]
MNGVAMLLQQVPSSKTGVPSNSKGAVSEGNPALFQSLLGEADAGNQATNVTAKANLLPEDIQKVLSQVIDKDGTDLNLNTLYDVEARLPILFDSLKVGSDGLESLLQDVSIAGAAQNSPVFESLMNTDLLSVNFKNNNTLDLSDVQKQLAEIFKQAEMILSQIGNQKDAAKASPKLLGLLQQWTALMKNTNNTELTSVNQGLPKEGTSEQNIWRDLLQAFQRRNKIAGHQQYRNEANVTSTDISKWLVKATETYGHTEKLAGQQLTSNVNMPLSRLEQYVIHMNQTQANTNAAGQELIEQFQKVMKSSRFQALPNGINQLSIALRPDNLGEMMVRFTQINGEMAVKIMVTSQAAKEMLESNMHQLRNMFSPHQVVVEKQEVNVQVGQDVLKEQKDDQLAEHEQNESQHSNKDDHQNSEGNFETQFHEMLMNEKV